jgi:TM2 domain-containing membrane protein YozV
MNQNPIEYNTPNSLAAIWSMMLPGLGQMMKGRIMPGIFWAIFVSAGYFSYFWPGLTLHALCILDAAFYKGNGSFIELNTWPQRLGFLALLAFLLVYIAIRNNF